MKLKLAHTAPLELCFFMASFFAKVKIFSFWPKTMDYSQGVLPNLRSLFVVLLLLAGKML